MAAARFKVAIDLFLYDVVEPYSTERELPDQNCGMLMEVGGNGEV